MKQALSSCLSLKRSKSLEFLPGRISLISNRSTEKTDRRRTVRKGGVLLELQPLHIQAGNKKAVSSAPLLFVLHTEVAVKL